MAIALRILAVREETLWYDQMQIVLGAGHGYIQEAALLLDLRRGASGEVRRDAAVHGTCRYRRGREGMAMNGLANPAFSLSATAPLRRICPSRARAGRGQLNDSRVTLLLT